MEKTNNFKKHGANRQALILGRAGSGKTTLIYNQLDALRPQAKAVIFDYKQDYKERAK